MAGRERGRLAGASGAAGGEGGWVPLGIPEAVRHPLPRGVPPARGFQSKVRGPAPVAAPPPSEVADIEELVGSALGDCTWVLGGWAIPLLDAPENETLHEACEVPWGTALGMHVSTASTCVLRDADGKGGQRLYIQLAMLLDDQSGGGYALPATNPADTAGSITRESPGANASGRFSADYIAFVDSTDGLTFPVYAPVYEASGNCGQPVRDTGAGAYDAAGWTPTALNCRTPAGAAPSSSGDYVAYRDPTVIDLRARYGNLGFCMMVCVEARSRAPIDAASDAFTEGKSGTDPLTNPRTRVVCFLSPGPDFAPGGLAPTPGQLGQAFVLVEPRAQDVMPQPEWYGVPTATITPDGDSLVLMVPWRDNRPIGKVPARVYQRYPVASGHRPPWYPPAGASATSGISVFVVSLDDLLVAIAPLWVPYVNNPGVSFSDPSRAALNRLFSEGYQGEVLAVDDEPVDIADIESFADMATYTPIDPHVHACSNVTWMYFDRIDSDSDPESGSQDKLTRLWAIDPRDYGDWFDPHLAPHLQRQGRLTVWIRPSCPDAIDLASSALVGAEVRDPDVSRTPDDAVITARFATEIDLSGGQVPGLAYAYATGECPTREQLSSVDRPGA